MKTLAVLCLLLNGCAGYAAMQWKTPTKEPVRCVPVIVDGEQKACMDQRELDDFMRVLQRGYM